MKKILSVLFTFIILANFNSAFALSPERTQTVEYMDTMANIPWKSESNIENDKKQYGVTYQKGNVYYGIPYSQNFRWTDLLTFLLLMRGDSYIGRPTGSHVFIHGSDCSSAVSMTWQQLNPSIPFLSTHYMIPTQNNEFIVKVGDYEVPNNSKTTIEVIGTNSKEKMMEAYSLLQPGDAIVTRSLKSGHVVLVKENDVENSQVTVIEQCGVDENGILLGKDGRSSWRDSSVKSYDELYGKNYIPISTPVLIASDKNSSTDAVDASLNSDSSLAA